MKQITVYKLTREDGLSYIGVATNFENRVRCHKCSERFREKKITHVEILGKYENYQDALTAERVFIEQYDTFRNGLNLTLTGNGQHHKGGQRKSFSTYGYKFSEKSRDKMRQSAIARGYSNGLREWWSNPENMKNLGEKLSNSRKGKVSHTRISEETVIEIFRLFKITPILQTVVAKNGRHRTHLVSFCKENATKFGITKEMMIKILSGKTIAWKHLYEDMVNGGN